MRHLGKTVVALGVITAVVGLAIAQQPGGFRMFGGGGSSMLVMNSSVQKELKLTDDQIAKLKELGGGRGGAGGAFAKFKDLSDEERREMVEKMKAAAEEREKKIAAILTPDQNKRLKQISRQNSGLMAFADAEVQTTLKLTDDQKDQIKTVGEDLQRDLGDLRKGVDFRDREKMAEMMKKTQAVSKEAVDKVKAMLTADQKTAWRELTGEPFEVKQEFGGFGGGKPGERRKKKDG
jgi:Spy/CpxP family protein refolding chaperone